MKKRECKFIRGEKYCKIDGKWVKVRDKRGAFRLSLSSKSPIKIKKGEPKRTGVC